MKIGGRHLRCRRVRVRRSRGPGPPVACQAVSLPGPPGNSDGVWPGGETRGRQTTGVTLMPVIAPAIVALLLHSGTLFAARRATRYGRRRRCYPKIQLPVVVSSDRGVRPFPSMARDAGGDALIGELPLSAVVPDAWSA
jgi:hypothetical protein